MSILLLGTDLGQVWDIYDCLISLRFLSHQCHLLNFVAFFLVNTLLENDIL